MPCVGLLDIYFPPGTELVDGVQAFFTGAAEMLRETDFADARPIATVALEVASTNERLRLVTAEVFEAWIAAGTESFRPFGLSEEAARGLIIAVITSLEGAFVLSRALRSTEPLEAAGAAAVLAARTVLTTA
jgi:hypothetical protein